MKDVMVEYQIIGNCLTDLLSVDFRFLDFPTRVCWSRGILVRFILFLGFRFPISKDPKIKKAKSCQRGSLSSAQLHCVGLAPKSPRQTQEHSPGFH